MPDRYPGAEWIPWAWNPNNPAYYNDQNAPEAVVLHVAQGYRGTVRQWAKDGYAGASWHYTVCRDGRVLQHLEHNDGGYHAGIERYRRDGSENPIPTWPLWKGWGVNVNRYTIGIEHEGFSGTQFTPEQMAASRELCRWLAGELGIPLDVEHFTWHGAIALIDRADDFNTAPLREEFYSYLLMPVVRPPVPPPGFDFTKVRLEPIGNSQTEVIPEMSLVDWSDKPNERIVTTVQRITTKQRMRIVVDP